MSALSRQTVAVVGASSGIGLATARAAAQGGAETILLSRSQARLEVAARSVPGTAPAIAMDMLDPAAVDRALASIGGIVMPGVVDTPRHGTRREAIKARAESPELPARRFGQPEDIAHAIVFLMTNPYVTGHTLVVDGGFLAA